MLAVTFVQIGSMVPVLGLQLKCPRNCLSKFKEFCNNYNYNLTIDYSYNYSSSGTFVMSVKQRKRVNNFTACVANHMTSLSKFCLIEV